MKQIVLMVAVTLMTTTVVAQNVTNVRGHVTDAHHANVARAEVDLLPRSGPAMRTLTDENGAYAFDHIATGDYVIEVRAKGFVTFSSSILRSEERRVGKECRDWWA